MSDEEHVLECYKEGSTDACICDELHACEQRVIAECDEQSQIAYSTGYRHALEFVLIRNMLAVRHARMTKPLPPLKH